MTLKELADKLEVLDEDAFVSLLRFFEETGIEIIAFTDLHWQRAVDAFSRFGKGRHPAALNFGDCLDVCNGSLGPPASSLPW